MITEKEQEEVVHDIWAGNTTVFSLPVIVYAFNRKELDKGVDKGYKKGTFKPESPDFITKTALKSNINSFAIHKTFQQVKDMTAIVFDEEGIIRPFNKFKEEASVIFKTYNKTWLEVEFHSAVAQSQQASLWNDVIRDKEALPMLEYVTIGDGAVRDEHAAWNGIIKPVDDPFWATRWPQNDFNCRCRTRQLEKGKETNLSTHLTKVNKEFKQKGKAQLPSLNNTSKVFKHNTGEAQVVWKEKGSGAHPYFSIDKQFEPLRDKNFGL